MKLIILVDSNCRSFEDMVNSVDNRKVLVIETNDGDFEYQHLVDAIREFSTSKEEIMLGKFSGKEEVLKELGDNNSEMIIGLSSNEDSINYAGEPQIMLSSLIDLFAKEEASV